MFFYAKHTRELEPSFEISYEEIHSGNLFEPYDYDLYNNSGFYQVNVTSCHLYERSISECL